MFTFSMGTRYRPIFFDQVGHENMYAFTMENIGGGMAALSKLAVGLIWLGCQLE